MKHKMHAHHAEHHSAHHSGHHSSHGIYRNEVEKPHEPMQGHLEHGMGCHEFKNEADSIAIGQAGAEGMRRDEGRIHSQFKDYHWD